MNDSADADLNRAFSDLYSEICRLAEQKLVHQPYQSIIATDLVHEVYMRLSKENSDNAKEWSDRRFFFASAGEAMRRVLVDPHA